MMRKALALALTVALVGGLFTVATAHGGRGGRWGQGYGSGPCWQESGERGWGRGMYGSSGDVDGRGFGPGRCLTGRTAEGVEGDVDTAEEASSIVSSMLEARRNPNLKVGKVTEAGRDYEVEIVTRDGSLANKLYVEKGTGRIFPAYR